MQLIVLKNTFLKLMKKNSVFGKKMKNLRKRISVELVNSAKKTMLNV